MLRQIEIVIIGGGATGTILALHLLQIANSNFSIQIVEPQSFLGCGLAYKDQSELNILNVPAEKMSAFRDRPDDFLNWLKSNHQSEKEFSTWPYVPRRIYGQYLESRLRSLDDGRLKHVRGKAKKICQIENFFEVQLDLGFKIKADYLIVATGYDNQSHTSKELATESVFDNVLDRKVTGSLLILGSGLSAIDVWRQVQGVSDLRVSFFSRRGLWPRSAASPPPASVSIAHLETLSPRELFRALRQLSSEGHDWNNLADYIRPRASTLWRSWDRRRKNQFINRLKPYWEVIRHRMPSVVFDELQKQLSLGKVELISARIRDLKKLNGKWEVTYSDRLSGRNMTATFDHVVLATGSRVDQTLLDHCIVSGLTKCSFGFGYINEKVPNLWVAGPASKGDFWEITAIAEIREQAASISTEILRMTRSIDL